MTTESNHTAKSRTAGFLLLLFLICCAFIGNYFAVRLFIGFNYLFGSIFVLLVVRLYGIRWGLLAGVAASAWTIVLFGHPYAMIWLCAEPLFVGWLLSRGRSKNLVLYDAIYWPLIGAPLLWFFFRYVMVVPFLGTVTALMMYWVIGITNALIASLLLTSFPRLSTIVKPEVDTATPIYQLIFNLMMAIVLLPAVIILIVHGRDTEQRYLQEMYDGVENSSRSTLYELRLLQREQNLSGRDRPEGAVSESARNEAVMQGRLLLARHKPFHEITLLDGSGRVIASTVKELPVTKPFDVCADGEISGSNTGSGIQRCLPSATSLMPRWQRVQASTYFMRSEVENGMEWSLVVETPFAPYQKLLFEDHRRALLVVLTLNMLVLATSLYTSRRLAAPLRRLSQLTTDLPERLFKNKVTHWPGSTVAEVDQLIFNFKTMADALNQKFQELTFAKEVLEQRVHERTEEIFRANSELQHEICEHKLTEGQRGRLMQELTQKNKELEGIIYIASHDLRSPLVNIQGFSLKLGKACTELERLSRSLELPADVRQLFDKLAGESIPRSLGFIVNSAEKMDGLLSGLLRLSRLGREALCFEILDMPLILEKIVSSMAFQLEKATARIELRDLHPCMADKGQVNQIFSNLLDNALKYRSGARPLVVKIYSEQFDEGIRYCVEDNGIGIPREHQEMIWDIFHRLNPDDTQGEGLGLTMARRSVDRLGGSIWVESEPDEGSRFYIILPVAARGF